MTKKTILLIDDDLAIHLQTKIVVEKAGHLFYAAMNADAGLKLARTQQPNLIILDFLMPGKDGLETYRQLIKQFEVSASEMPPVIMLTAANHSEAEKKSLLKNGISAYLEKPFGPRELVNVIQNVFVTNQIKIEGIGLRQAIEENRNFLQNLIESCPVLIVTADKEGNVTYVNHFGQKMFNLKEGEIIGCPVTSFFPEIERLTACLLDSDRDPTEAESFECDMVRNSANTIAVRCICSQLCDKSAQPNGFLIVAQDISSEKRLATELIEKERLIAITESFATINHKLNNPLTPILGNLQLLRQEGNYSSEKDYRKKLDVIEDNARKISEIVKSFGKVSVPVTKKYYGDANTLEFVTED